MNIGHRKTLTNAPRATDRATILSMIETDRMNSERVVKLPALSFLERRLPGEDRWARERIAPRTVE